jgi:hypothetical protein
VESYPCPICVPERIFLTVAGLERHASESHGDDPAAVAEIRRLTRRIQTEWARRRRGIGTGRGLIRPASIKQEVLGGGASTSQQPYLLPRPSQRHARARNNLLHSPPYLFTHQPLPPALTSVSNSSSTTRPTLDACRTKCELCGLTIVRPSLLLRHMFRVHNQRDFSAAVWSQYVPPMGFSVRSDGGEGVMVVWECCGESYVDK